MMQLVQITAQYSNAVLVAILPYVSDFARKLDLAVPTPVTASQVLDFKCDPRQGQAGGLVTLTNGLRFTFLDGRVCVYRSPQSYFSLQDPDLIPSFYGPVKVKQSEALRIARAVIQKLGYTEGMFGADAAPEITVPERIGTNHVDRYRFRWRDKNSRFGKAAENLIPVLLDIEVDASTRQIQMVSIASPVTRGASPKVDVSPPLLRPPTAEQQLAGEGFKTGPVNPAYSTAFLEAILPQLSDFAAKIGLLTDLPLGTDKVDLSRYHCRVFEGQPMAQLFLKNGDRFNYGHGHVTAFYGHDAYRKFPEEGRVEDFLGKINMSTNDAISMCERAIKSLGYTAKLPKAFFAGPTFIGTNEFSRCVFYWPKPGEEFASFEVDMETGRIKSAYLDHPSLWRDPPKIGVPMVLGTNAPFVPHVPNLATVETNEVPVSHQKSGTVGRELFPKDGLDVLENAEDFTVLSLDPEPETKATNTFHGYRVLGKIGIRDASERHAVLSSIYAGMAIDGPEALCFDPRHGIHAQSGNRVEDLVICFECGQVYFHGVSEGKLVINGTPAASLNRVLSAAHVPISK